MLVLALHALQMDFGLVNVMSISEDGGTHNQFPPSTTEMNHHAWALWMQSKSMLVINVWMVVAFQNILAQSLQH